MLARFDRALLVANRWTVIAMLAAWRRWSSPTSRCASRPTSRSSGSRKSSRYLMIWLTLSRRRAGAALRRPRRHRHAAGGAAAASRGDPRARSSALLARILRLHGLRSARATRGSRGARPRRYCGIPDRRGLSRDSDRLRASDRASAADGAGRYVRRSGAFSLTENSTPTPRRCDSPSDGRRSFHRLLAAARARRSGRVRAGRRDAGRDARRRQPAAARAAEVRSSPASTCSRWRPCRSSSSPPS